MKLRVRRVCSSDRSLRPLPVICAHGISACSRWHPDQLHGCRLCTSGARRIRDLDKSITSVYQEPITRVMGSCFYSDRLTTAPTRIEFVQPLFQQRSDRWRQTVRRSITSNTNVSFKQIYSHVAAFLSF